MSNFNDKFPEVKGFVKIRAFDSQTGALLWELANKNLILYGMRDVLGELLVQATLLPGARAVGDLVIETMKMGTSNASTDRSQTGLQSAPVVSKTFSSANVSNPSPGEYVFTVTMTTAEGNGSTFQEVGLFTVDGTCLCRQVHSAYLKDNTQNVEYIYTLQWT